MTSRKRVSQEGLPAHIRYLSRSFSANTLIDLLREAAVDGGGGKVTPRLYDLIDLHRSNLGGGELHRKLVDAVITILSDALQTFDADVAFQFRKLLRDTELIDWADTVRKAIKTYIDSRIPAGDVNALNFAVGILRTARPPAKAAAEAWLPTLRGLMQQAPSWLVLDVLIEMKGLVSEDQYSERHLISDIQKLFDRPEYTREIGRRQAQLLKQWQISSQHLEGVNSRSPNVKLNDRTVGGSPTVGCDISGLAQQVGQRLGDNVVPLRKSA